jgi:TatD DNase family protein
MFSYFDSHSHLNLSPLREEKEKIIKTLEEEKIGTTIVGTDFATSLEAVETAKQSPNLFACVGLHPTDSAESFDYEKFLSLAKDPKVVAIGECGLDYFHASPRSFGERLLSGTKTAGLAISEQQKENFLKQIALAREVGKPLMIHSRPSKRSMDAYRDILDILKSNPDVGGNSHFFAGNLEIAKEFLNLGFTLSFAGPITFVPDYDRVIEYAPIEMILSETDAPFAAPAPYRGKTCYPQYVREVVKRIAEIKKLPLEEVKKQLVLNAQKTFNL